MRDFEELFVQAVKSNILADGVITAKEVAWLRKAIFADAKVDAIEKHLLSELRAGAQSTCPEFEQLCQECGV